MAVEENVKRVGHKVAIGKFTAQFPLLVERAKEWGFDLPSDAPWGDRIIVWRLPPLQPTESGLWIPDDEKSPHVLGVLVAAGMQALDQLESNGITLGHMVKWERFAGWEHNDVTPEHKRGSRFIHLQARQILTSLDLKDHLEAGSARYVRGEDGRNRLGGTDVLRQIAEAPKTKRAKVLALASDSGATPAEKATARRIAKRLK